MVINSVPYSKQILELELALRLSIQHWDQCQYLSNCPPTPPLTQHETLTCYQLTDVGLGEGQVHGYSDTDIDLSTASSIRLCI